MSAAHLSFSWVVSSRQGWAESAAGEHLPWRSECLGCGNRRPGWSGLVGVCSWLRIRRWTSRGPACWRRGRRHGRLLPRPPRHGDGFQLHRLLQTVIRNRMAPLHHDQRAATAVALLAAADPGDPLRTGQLDRVCTPRAARPGRRPTGRRPSGQSVPAAAAHDHLPHQRGRRSLVTRPGTARAVAPGPRSRPPRHADRGGVPDRSADLPGQARAGPRRRRRRPASRTPGARARPPRHPAFGGFKDPPWAYSDRWRRPSGPNRRTPSM